MGQIFGVGLRAAALFGGVAFVGLCVAGGIIYYALRDRPAQKTLVESGGVYPPVLTGTRWEARDTKDNHRFFDIEFLHGDQNKDEKLRANVITSRTNPEHGGTYKNLHLEFKYKLSDGDGEIKADINPNNTDEMNGTFTSILAPRKFIARKKAATQ